jgi:hypothetical protein
MRRVTVEEFDEARRRLTEAVSPSSSVGRSPPFDSGGDGDDVERGATSGSRCSPSIGPSTPLQHGASPSLYTTPRNSTAALSARQRVFESLRDLANSLSAVRDVLRPVERECLRKISAAVAVDYADTLSLAADCVDTLSLVDVQNRLAQLYSIKLTVHDLCVGLWATDTECTVERCVETGYTAAETVAQQLPAPPAEIEARGASSGATGATSIPALDLLSFSSIVDVHACARKLERLCTQLSQDGWPTEERLKPPASIDKRWLGSSDEERLEITDRDQHSNSGDQVAYHRNAARGTEVDQYIGDLGDSASSGGTLRPTPTQKMSLPRDSPEMQHQLEQLQSPVKTTDLQGETVRTRALLEHAYYIVGCRVNQTHFPTIDHDRFEC